MNFANQCKQLATIGMANGKSETRRDAETVVLKFEPETKKCSDLIEKQICDRQTQNLRSPPLIMTQVENIRPLCTIYLIFMI